MTLKSKKFLGNSHVIFVEIKYLIFFVGINKLKWSKRKRIVVLK